MPSRKTEEIKIRVTPEEKSAWQQMAVEENASISGIVRQMMNARAALCPADVVEPEVDFRGAGWNTPPPECVPTSVAPVAIESQLSDEDLEVIKLDAEPTPRSVPKRRTEQCHCGKPTWIYCGECGS